MSQSRYGLGRKKEQHLVITNWEGSFPDSSGTMKLEPVFSPAWAICQHPGLGRLNPFPGLSVLHLEMNEVMLTVHLLGKLRDSEDNISSS